jgi:Ca-activated chloride channel family protein
MSILNFNACLDNEYALDSSGEFYLYAELKAARAMAKKERIPLNISLVIDRSGSMSGDKLAYAIKAVEFVIQNLTSEDYLSVIQYDDKVSVVSISEKVTNKDNLIRKTREIRPGGSTNLSGGMLAGYEQVAKTQKEGFVNRILLLSDGLANCGVTNPDDLKTIAQNYFRDRKIGTSAFGLGSDFNEELMMSLAEYGGANYYFIKIPDQIPQIFADELHGLLNVVTQNTVLEISFPLNFEVEKVFGYVYQQSENKLSINFNDMYSEEEKAILVKFRKKAPLFNLSEFNVNINFADVAETMMSHSMTKKLNLNLTKDIQLYNNSFNNVAAENVAFFVTSDMFNEVTKLVDQNRIDLADQKLKQAIEYLKTKIETLGYSDRLMELQQALINYETSVKSYAFMEVSEARLFQKSAKMEYYSLNKRKK